MLIKVKMLDHSLSYAYVPLKVEAVINTEKIVSAHPTEERGDGPFLLIRFRDGSEMTIQGRADDLLVRGA